MKIFTQNGTLSTKRIKNYDRTAYIVKKSRTKTKLTNSC